MISTPESGVDSIALTYSLLGPVLAVIRPIAAFFTALVAGVVNNLISDPLEQEQTVETQAGCTAESNHRDSEPTQHTSGSRPGIREKTAAAMRFAFDELMADLTVWFLLGILLAGIITALVPASFIGAHAGSGIVSYIAMLAVSLPLYVCASMSTPIAAALVMKGLSPGAALIFMMAGPATNMATITVVGGLLGRRTLAVYLGSVTICTLLIAFVTDTLFHVLGISLPTEMSTLGREIVPETIQVAAAVLLMVLMLRVLWKRGPLSLARQAFSRRPAAPATSDTACCDAAPGGG